MTKKLQIRDLTLRDGQQSLFATRMKQENIDRLLPLYRNAKFYIMEVWGGAVPDSVMRYLGESPWNRLRSCSEAMKGISLLSALSRGRRKQLRHSGRHGIIEYLSVKHAVEHVAGRSCYHKSHSHEKATSQSGQMSHLGNKPYEKCHGNDTSECKEQFARQLHAKGHAVVFYEFQMKP